jgi:hypothetical protein
VAAAGAATDGHSTIPLLIAAGCVKDQGPVKALILHLLQIMGNGLLCDVTVNDFFITFFSMIVTFLNFQSI